MGDRQGRPRRHGRLRPVDLARAAGVSAQQIRNYEAAGVLPPASRTESGYRTFTARHRRAVLTYRALARGYGPYTAQAVMLALHDGDVPRALALVDEGHADLHEQRRSLRESAHALETIAAQDPEAARPPRPDLRIGQAAARIGVRTSALRVWEDAGLLSPQRDPATGHRRYGARELRDARLVATLRRGRYPLPRIAGVLDGLRRTGSTDALRAALAQRQDELDRRARAMLEGASLLHGYVGELEGARSEGGAAAAAEQTGRPEAGEAGQADAPETAAEERAE